MKMMIYCFTYLCFCYPEPYSDVGRSYCCVFYEIFSLLAGRSGRRGIVLSFYYH